MGSPGTICVKFYRRVTDGQSIKWRRNIAENFNRLSRVHERYGQTSDRRTDDDTFAMHSGQQVYTAKSNMKLFIH